MPALAAITVVTGAHRPRAAPSSSAGPPRQHREYQHRRKRLQGCSCCCARPRDRGNRAGRCSVRDAAEGGSCFDIGTRLHPSMLGDTMKPCLSVSPGRGIRLLRVAVREIAVCGCSSARDRPPPTPSDAAYVRAHPALRRILAQRGSSSSAQLEMLSALYAVIEQLESRLVCRSHRSS